MTGAGHTGGPLKVVADHPQNACVAIKREVSGWPVELATLYGASEVCSVGEDGVWPDQPVRDLDARLFAAAYTSYDRHFGPRAVEAAEADLLGVAIDTLADTAEQLEAAGGYWESSDLLTRIQSILSQAQAREVRSS